MAFPAAPPAPAASSGSSGGPASTAGAGVADLASGGQAPGGQGPRVTDRLRALVGRFGLSGRNAVIAVPYFWLLLFFLVPFLIVGKIALSEAAIRIPPYLPILDWSPQETMLTIKLNLNNFAFMLRDDLYIVAYLNSLKIAFISTVICILIGYPVAYAIAKADATWRAPLLMLIILPFWTSFLIRVYAWIVLLRDEGLVTANLNAVLLSLGIIDQPLKILYTPTAAYIGIVYSYLPFMILPLYATLEKLDNTLLEAASDLGSPPWKSFLTITLPLSLPGVLAGSLLVFIPATGEFVIPELLGGPDTLMIGQVLWAEFFNNRDWPVASAVAIALLLFLVVPIMLFQNVQGRQEGR
ncbi:MAG: putrescine transport system permease protein PotH [Pseudomonadota bacterium]|jgi:putrescine transport system permease protein